MALFVFGCRWFFKSIAIAFVMGFCLWLNLDVGDAAPLSQQTRLNNALARNIETGKLKQVKFLLAHGADPNSISAADHEPLVQRAISMMHPAILKMLLDHGANPDGPPNYHEDTPLLAAVSPGYLSMVHLLLSHGAHVNLADNRGITPLMVASQTQPQPESGVTIPFAIVSLLYAHGANIQAVDAEGKTPLIYAASDGSLNSLDFLIRHGARVNVRANNGRTALMYAVNNDDGWTSLKCAARLIAAGADVNAQDLQGMTPLHWVASDDLAEDSDAVQTARLLIQHGARLDAKENNGKTPLDMAVTDHLDKLSKYLRSVSQ